MNKFLRLTLLVVMAVSSLCGFSKTVTIDFNANGLSMFDGITKVSTSSSDDGDFTEEKKATIDGVTITVSPSNTSTANRFWKDSKAGTQLRLYGGTLKLSASQNITKVVFSKGSKWKGISASTGTQTNDTTWTSDGINEVTFTVTVAKGNQAQINKIEITLADDGPVTPTLAAPTISGTTTFTESTTVSISAAEGATVYYTTDGQDPDKNKGTLYSAPFSISETTTVKAIAYSGDLVSTILSTTFTKQTVESAANIAAFTALDDNTPAVLTLSDAKVLYSWTSSNGNNSTYIRDATGALCLYNAGLDSTAGQVLNGTVNLTRSSYNNTIQGIKNDNTSSTTLTAVTGDAPVAKTVTTAEAKNSVSDLVELKNVNVYAVGTKYYIKNGDDSIQVYNGFHIDGYTVAAAENVDVKGIMVRYKNTYEIYPTEAPATTGINKITNNASDENAPVYNLAGQRVDKSYKGIVIKKGKKYLNK